MLFFPTRSSFNSFLTRLSLIAGDLGDHSESEDDEEGEAEKTRWEGIFFSLLHHFTSGARKIFFIIFFLIFLISGGRRCRTWRSGSRWSRRWSTRPTLPSSRTRTRTCETWTSKWTAMWTWIRVGGGQVGSKWSIRCFRKPTVFADCETFQKGAKLKLRHNKRSETLGVTLVHTQQC